MRTCNCPRPLPPAPPAVLQHYFREDGALVLSIKPIGEALATHPLVVYIGDDTVVDETQPPPS